MKFALVIAASLFGLAGTAAADDFGPPVPVPERVAALEKKVEILEKKVASLTAAAVPIPGAKSAAAADRQVVGYTQVCQNGVCYIVPQYASAGSAAADCPCVTASGSCPCPSAARTASSQSSYSASSYSASYESTASPRRGLFGFRR